MGMSQSAHFLENLPAKLYISAPLSQCVWITWPTQVEGGISCLILDLNLSILTCYMFMFSQRQLKTQTSCRHQHPDYRMNH